MIRQQDYRYEIKYPLLKQGENELEIRLSSNKTQSNPIILTGVEINIAYKWKQTKQSLFLFSASQ